MYILQNKIVYKFEILNIILMSKTRIDLEEITEDVSRACGEGFGGLLIIGGTKEEISLLQENFQKNSGNEYPVIIKTREEYEASKRNALFDGKMYYQVSLDQIELISFYAPRR